MVFRGTFRSPGADPPFGQVIPTLFLCFWGAKVVFFMIFMKISTFYEISIKYEKFTFLRTKIRKVGVAGGPRSCKWLYNSNVLGAPGAGGPSRDPIYPIFTDFNEF